MRGEVLQRLSFAPPSLLSQQTILKISMASLLEPIAKRYVIAPKPRPTIRGRSNKSLTL